MHCPATYYTAYNQPTPPEMCYSSPYQAYYQPKVYQTGPVPPSQPSQQSYRRYYYPASDMYDSPSPQNLAQSGLASSLSSATATPVHPISSSQQIVPVGGSNGSQHIDHHYPYYTGYSPGGGGQCYSFGIQPPYMGKEKYDNSHYILLIVI